MAYLLACPRRTYRAVGLPRREAARICKRRDRTGARRARVHEIAARRVRQFNDVPHLMLVAAGGGDDLGWSESRRGSPQ